VKILYVDLETEWRGGQGQALLTVQGLLARGHEAELLAAESGALARRAQACSVPVHAVSGHRRRWHAAQTLRKLLQKNNVEVIHANEPHALTAAWLARAHRRAALAVSRRVAYPLGRGWMSQDRYQAADRILAISRFVAESVVKSGIPRERITLVYEGVEIPAAVTREMRQAARRTLNIAEDEFLLGCIGYLLPEKGQDHLVRAMPAILKRSPRCRLLFAGDGPERRHLEALAAGLGIRDRILFAGFVEQVAEIYAALDLFVFPSIAEPLGTSLLKAMAYGLPIAGVASGGVPEYVESGVNGILAAKPSPEAIAEAILPLLNESAIRDRIGKRARKDMTERFSSDVMVENTILAYEDVVRKHHDARKPCGGSS
jgi:glycosyltransferase involved in cell wall biosynthesis